MKNLIISRVADSIEVKKSIIQNDDLLIQIEKLANDIIHCLDNKGKVLICGNGGSASDALHMAGELLGRFQVERKGLPVVALNSDIATLTAVANDYGYDDVFARQVEALMNKEDLFIGISTSGNSKNVYNAMQVAKKVGGKTSALLGKDGGKMYKEVDIPILVPSNIVARVQESHITIIHILCEIIDLHFKGTSTYEL